MNNIILIIGLPCSGKTTLANFINNDNNGKYRIIDDPTNFNLDILPYINDDIIITDPNLCFDKNRNSAIELINKHNKNCKIDFIYFENDPESCLLNYENRSGRDVKKFIENFSKFYKIPKNSNIVKVYKKNM